MNIDKEILEFLKRNLHKGCLESFGIKQQFIELEFSNSKFEEIKFFVDCSISTPDNETNKHLALLKGLDEDTFEIAYFLKANLKCISDCGFDENGNFKINFENDYRIDFNLSTNEEANMSITFRKKESSKSYIAVDILPGGIVKIN
jgi:hypothetical protein